jgi:hypothetical protein
VDAVVISPREVAAIIPTRGNVDVRRILSSLIFPSGAIWDNSQAVRDLGAFGRYAAIVGSDAEWIYTQDDDCLVPEDAQRGLLEAATDGVLVSNMNADHNGRAMPLLALPGWGAIFHRSLPQQAFERWREAERADFMSDDFLRIGCDIVFPVLTPSRMVDLGHENLPHAWDEDRTHRRVDYGRKKAWYYERAAALREKVAA